MCIHNALTFLSVLMAPVMQQKTEHGVESGAWCRKLGLKVTEELRWYG